MIANLILHLCSEQSIAQSRASVMLYNNERKEWEHSGGSSGISRVHVYHHPTNNTYRIVGRKVQDHTVCELVLENYAPLFMIFIYYINTNEIPGELSRENMISSHCYLHM